LIRKKGEAKPPKEGLIIDSSVSIAWCFPDEQDDYTQSVLDALASQRAFVPDLRHLEVTNALLVGERRKRSTQSNTVTWLGFLEGKSAISREMTEILERLGSSAETWQTRLQKLRTGRPLGRFFAASRQRLREAAERLGLRRVPHLGGCLAS
jgi:predicted nucleic acid-binding protein